MIRRIVRVHGRVQGVGFRYSCARKAEELGIRGSVRNRSDGAVEADFEGDEDAVAEMIQWARTGPRFARVTGIEVEEADPAGSSGFRVD